MSQEHPECGEIRVGQLGQDFGVNGIVAKCLLVLLQPETMQKARDVHARRPRRTARRESVRHRAQPVQRATTAARSYWFSQRRMKPSSPWGMKITMAMKMIPSGIR
jgi:hypothetical protein